MIGLIGNSLDWLPSLRNVISLSKRNMAIIIVVERCCIRCFSCLESRLDSRSARFSCLRLSLCDTINVRRQQIFSLFVYTYRSRKFQYYAIAMS